MRRYFLLISLLLLQTPTTGRIEGVVLKAGSTVPITDARVTLYGGGIPPSASAPFVMTDINGRFAFKGLAAGNYRVSVGKDGYAVENMMAAVFPGAFVGRPVTLDVGQNLDSLEFRLTPEAVVSGRVTGGQGEPVVNAEVQLMVGRYEANGRRTYGPAAVARTNDRGEYRFWGINSMPYLLRVGPPQVLFDLRSSDGIGPRYLATFYPGTTKVSEAAVLDIQPGTDLAKMDIAMAARPRQNHSIRGRILDARAGQSSPNGIQYTVFPLEENAPSFLRFYTTSPDGTFELENIDPGSWVIQAQVATPVARPEPGEPLPAFPTLYSRVHVDVVANDIEGVVVILKPIEVSGQLRVAGQSEVPKGLRVHLRNYFGNWPQPASVKADGSFVFSDLGVGGEYYLTLSGLGSDMYIRELRFGEVDVRIKPLRISEAVSGSIQIVLAANGASIDGDGAIGNSRIGLVPNDRSRLDLYRVVPADPSGVFSIRGIPPGGYKLFVIENATEAYPFFDPEFLNSVEQQGRAITLTEGVHETFHLTR